VVVYRLEVIGMNVESLRSRSNTVADAPASDEPTVRLRALARLVGRVLLAIEVIGDAIWRWRYARYSMRTASGRALERWAHRHSF
jgi:hypothetical protein